MIVQSALDLMFGNVFFEMNDILPQVPVYLKLEGFTIGRSIKMKTALNMIEDLENRGVLVPGKKVVESSSGNLGLALSIICGIKGYTFTCVSDPNLSLQTRRMIEANGGQVWIVDQTDENGGYLNTRINLIKSWLTEDPDYVWINQYANPANKEAHARWTAPEILQEFPDLDYLFIVTSTTGTLMGCLEHLHQVKSKASVIAVDSVGSVTFGHPPGPRYIPGAGASRKPELVDSDRINHVIMVPEHETIMMCRRIRNQFGLLIGGSTGTVLCGVQKYADQFQRGNKIVAISPDFGDSYTDTIFNDQWVIEHYPSLKAQIECFDEKEKVYNE